MKGECQGKAFVHSLLSLISTKFLQESFTETTDRAGLD